MVNSPNIIITGVSGFLGRHVAESLVKMGYTVYGISRTNPNIKDIIHVSRNLEFDTVEGLPVTTIIHCAAGTNDGWDTNLELANINITSNALKIPHTRFVYISSSSVYNLSQPSIEVEESSTTDDYPMFNSYSRSKRYSEVLVTQTTDNHIILRPHAIYGANDTTLLPRLKDAIRKGKIYLPNGGDVLHRMTSIDNLFEAIILSIEVENVQGIFNITDADGILVKDAVIRALKDEIRIIKVSVGLALFAARLFALFPNRNKRNRVTEYAVLQLGLQRTYNINKAKAILGYYPANNSFDKYYT